MSRKKAALRAQVPIVLLLPALALLMGAATAKGPEPETEVFVVTKAWRVTESTGCLWLVTFDESTKAGAITYDNLRRLLPSRPVNQWTLVWLEINNQKGGGVRSYDPLINRLHMTWKDKKGLTRRAISEDMSAVITKTADERNAGRDDALKNFLDLFSAGDVPAGDHKLKVVIFNTDSPVEEEEAEEFHVDMSRTQTGVRMAVGTRDRDSGKLE